MDRWIVKDDRVARNTYDVYITHMLKDMLHPPTMYTYQAPIHDWRRFEVLQIAVAAPAEGCHGGLPFVLWLKSKPSWFIRLEWALLFEWGVENCVPLWRGNLMLEIQVYPHSSLRAQV